MIAKKRIEDLKVFGGTPLFPSPCHVGRPNLPEKKNFLRRVESILESRWLSNRGPQVLELEKALCRYTGAKHAITVCNATVGIEVLAKVLDLKGEVIVPSFTFIATAHALRWLGIEPVFADVLPDTHSLDPASVARCLSPRTSAIMGVHLWGEVGDVTKLEQLARKAGVPLLFDAAHAFLSTKGGVQVGNFGTAEVLSFHATKFLSAGEGGAILTNEDSLAERIRYAINFGFKGYDQVDSLGINGKMAELPSALALSNLEQVDRIIQTNQEHLRRYQSELNGIEGLDFFKFSKNEKRNYQYVIAEVNESRFGLSRDELVNLLHGENVLARRYFTPGCHKSEPYRSTRYTEPLPVTERLSREVIALPTGTALSSAEVSAISGLIRFLSENAQALRDRLRKVLPKAA